MKNIYSFTAFLFAILFLSSCYQTKEISYFQDIDKYKQEHSGSTAETNYQIKIRPDDELRIIVSAAVNPEAAAPFNLSPYTSQSPSSTTVTNAASYQSYLVDAEGNVTIPSLGKLKVAGLTTEEAKSLVESRLKQYLKDPIVTLRLLSFRVSIIGEVNLPGVQSYDRQRVTVLDAIAQAKDLTIYAMRDKVQLIRDYDGKKEFYTFDLTKSDFMSSPYFYLKPNDVIYVTPNKERQSDANAGQGKQYRTSLTMSIVSISMGVVSTVATILAVTKN